MKTMLKVALAVLLIGALGVTIHCNNTDDGGDPQGMVIKIYEVPEGYDSMEWAKSLNRALYVNKENKVGEVEIGPNDALIITAQRSAFPGIEQLIESFKKAEPRKTETISSVAVDYWTIVGRPVEDGSEKIRIASRALARQDRLLPALREITSRQGAMEFTLLEQLRLTSLSSQRQASVDGRFMKVEHAITSTRGGEHTADVKINMVSKRGYLNTVQSRVKLVPGQLIVLGQSAIDGEEYSAIDDFETEEGLMLYYVISSEID